jgi:putative PIN family toxin of toxin-antitoxin system
VISYAEKPKVVFDCNVVIQAISNELGPAGRALNLLEQNRIRVFTSRLVLRELRLVLDYPNVRRSLPNLNDARIAAFLQRFTFRATLLRRVPHLFDYPRARQDEPYLDLADAADADFLVSRDSDLLSLAGNHTLFGKRLRQRCPRLRIVDPVTFLACLKM